MSRLRVSRQAIEDLRDIGRYTLQRWGRAQRRAYLRSINARFGELSRNPMSGMAREDIGPQWRSALAGRHMIFYRLGDQGIEIVRVLHGGMDVKRHVSPAGDPDEG